MRRPLRLAAAALLLAATASPALAVVPVVADGAWVRLPAVSGRPAAAYMTLTAGPKPLELVGAVSPLVERIELHSTSMAGGVMRMDKLPSVRLAPGQPFAFKPGGAHLMLFGVSAAAKPKGTLPITLRFKDGSTTKVEAMLHAAGETHGGGHH